MNKQPDKHIVFFDGYCTLCNHWVNFMLRRDKTNALYYASLQGETAKQELIEEYLNTVDTIILKSNDQFYFQSTASLRAFAKLGGIYRLAYVLLVVPPFIRNWVYRLISRNRYQWFGKQDVSRMPTEAEAMRLLP